MKETREQLQAQIAEAKRQAEVWEHRMQRAQNRERYVRSMKDRKRTHRLILYGAVIESQHKELQVLRDDEVVGLMERVVRVPAVEEEFSQAVVRHNQNIDPDPGEV